MEQSTQEQSPPTALSPARLLTGHSIPGGDGAGRVSPADLSAGQRERREYLSVLRLSRIFRNSPPGLVFN